MLSLSIKTQTLARRQGQSQISFVIHTTVTHKFQRLSAFASPTTSASSQFRRRLDSVVVVVVVSPAAPNPKIESISERIDREWYIVICGVDAWALSPSFGLSVVVSNM